MADLKVLPQKAYSIKDVIEYVAHEYKVSLNEKNLLNYIKEGELIASIYIEGNKEKIKRIDFLDAEIKIFPENSFLTVKQSKEKLIKVSETIYGTSIYDEQNMANVSFCIKNEDTSFIDKLENISFEELRLVRYLGYFKIPKETLFINIDEIFDDSFLLPPVLNLLSNDSNISIKLVSFPENVKIRINSLYILHDDLISFLSSKLKNEINLTNYENEIKNLQQQLEEKNREIEDLKFAIDKENRPILLNKFMENDRLSLAIQARKEYWSNYNPDLNNAPKAAPTALEIKDKYKLSQKQAEAIEIIACPINRN